MVPGKPELKNDKTPVPHIIMDLWLSNASTKKVYRLKKKKLIYIYIYIYFDVIGG